MSAESEASTVTQSRVMRIGLLKPFPTLTIGITVMGTEKIHVTVKTILHQTLYLIYKKTIASRIGNAQCSGM